MLEAVPFVLFYILGKGTAPTIVSFLPQIREPLALLNSFGNDA